MQWYKRMNEKIIPRVLVVYLPQFHETEDNNKWWGEGFTDWESVKQAEPCFEGHNAPWKPLNDNYYDLNKVETLKWQAELAIKYGVDGFSFYHYYFKDGKKELERPAELLLQHPEINMPFCFNWASEPWIRSWSRISGNVWSEKFEGNKKSVDPGVLVEQDYGLEDDWKKHFDYLLPFFKDERYIKIDNKPVFIFYRPGDINCLSEMIGCWRKCAEQTGLDGLYLIGVNVNASLYSLDASLIYEPRHSINKMNEQGLAKNLDGVRCFEYSDAWEAVLDSQPYKGVKTFFTGISGYDDTPRRGKSGECLIYNSPILFEDGFRKLLVKSMQYRNELVFINAWNEWGEGMYLEPDEQYRYKYLEAILSAKEKASSVEIKYIDSSSNQNIKIDEEKQELLYSEKKYKSFLEIYDKWLYLERKKKFSIAEYLMEQNVANVAVYGFGILGKQVYEQLIYEQVTVSYGVDRYVGQYGKDLVIIRPEDISWPNTDAVIVTTFEEENVSRFVKNKTNAKILKLSEIIDYMWRKYEFKN